MRDDEKFGIAVFTAVLLTLAFALVGWGVAAYAGGGVPDDLASAFQFGVVGAAIGIWLVYHLLSEEAAPLWAMLGVAVVGVWFIGLMRVAKVLREGATTAESVVRSAGRNFFQSSGYGVTGGLMPEVTPTLLDAWWLNLIVGLAGGALILYGLVRERL